jgi:selenocysteine-specific elongation factor
LVRINAELVFHCDAVNGLLARLAPLRGQLVDVGEFKALAEVSRKYAIPLLEHFDKRKVTLRDGNKRRIL